MAGRLVVVTATVALLAAVSAVPQESHLVLCGYAVLQLLLAPLLLWRSVVAALLSNALYAFALGYYHYLSFLGYSALPFLEHTEARQTRCSMLGRQQVHACLQCSQKGACALTLFLHGWQVFLWPIALILVVLPLAVLTGFSPTRFTLNIYFG